VARAKPAKILVPVSGKDVDKEAIELACRMASQNKGKVYVAHVIEVKRSLPLDANLEQENKQADDILMHAENIAEELGHEVDTDVIRARETGPAIISVAMEQHVDSILMGVDLRKRFGGWHISDEAVHVLKNAPCRVILLRQPLP